jgi:hypothetical protein
MMISEHDNLQGKQQVCPANVIAVTGLAAEIFTAGSLGRYGWGSLPGILTELGRGWILQKGHVMEPWGLGTHPEDAPPAPLQNAQDKGEPNAGRR